MRDGPPMTWRLRSTRDRTSCFGTVRHVQTYVDNQLGQPLAARVSNHLSQCWRCGLQAESYRRLSESLRRLAPLDLAPVSRLRAFASGLQ